MIGIGLRQELLGFGGSAEADLRPAAPLLTVVEPVTNPPALDADLPSGNGSHLDAAVGDTLRVQITLATDTGFASVVDEATVVLDSDDLTADVIEVAGLDTLDADDYIARARLERPDVGNSAWSTTTASFEVPSSWSPLDDANLKMWYSAHEDDAALYSDAGTTPATDGQGVQQANDLSGSGYHLKQSISGKRPDVLDAGINGHRVLDFVVANEDTLLTDIDAVHMGSGAPVSFAIVCEMHSQTGSFGRVATFVRTSGNDSSSASLTLAMRFSGANSLSAKRANTKTGEQAISLETPVIFAGVFDGTNGITYLNNSNAQTTANTGSFGGVVGCFALGVHLVSNVEESGGASRFDGRIGEVIVSLRAWDSDERTQVYDYLAAKWGL